MRDLVPISTRYDSITIVFHWVTAAIVLFQFLSAEFWDYFPRADKNILIISHMSLGFVLATILSFRIAWRLFLGIRISETAPTLLDRAAKGLHILLYTLLVAQIPLGFFTQWTGNQPLDVFGLLIPSPLDPCSKATGDFVDQVHDINAWVIMGLAGIHAIAGLVHHFIWRDDVLQRMLPSLRKS